MESLGIGNALSLDQRLVYLLALRSYHAKHCQCIRMVRVGRLNIASCSSRVEYIFLYRRGHRDIRVLE